MLFVNIFPVKFLNKHSGKAQVLLIPLFLVALEVTTDRGTCSDVTASSHALECKGII